MLRLSAVSYLNTKPYLDYLHRYFSYQQLMVRLEVPSENAATFLRGHADIALIPVGSLLDFSSVSVLDSFCIGANGSVDSVFLLSNKPVREVKSVILDSHSRTSNGLAKILFARHWKQDVEFLDAESDEKMAARVLIGDRTFAAKDEYKYSIDLASAWKEYTGLPFAFAIWVLNPNRVSKENIELLKKAFAEGLNNLNEVAAKWSGQQGLSAEKLEAYYRRSIDYNLDEKKIESMNLYLKYLAEIENRSLTELNYL